jgi:hypothetical protein
MPKLKHYLDSDSSDDDRDEFTIQPKKGSKTTPTQPKRRGRPKKSQEGDKSIEPEKKTKSTHQAKPKEENIILHLALSDDDDSSSEKNGFTMVDDTESCHKVATILSISDDESASDQKNMTVQHLLAELKRKDEIIKRLGKTITDIKSVGYDNNVSATRDSKSTVLDFKLIDIKSGKPVVTDSSDMVCWWDACPFDTVPFFIPDRYCGTTYYVFGNFCSLSCALAYNAEMDDYRTSIRSALIKKMHQHIFGQNEVLVESPQRELLFSKHISIDEFRSKCNLLKKEYKMKLPPMIPLLPVVDESTRDTTIVIPSKIQQYKNRSSATKKVEDTIITKL